MLCRIQALAWGALLSLGLWANAVAAEENAMGADDISALVKGKRLSGERVGGGQVRIKFVDNGALSIQDGHAVETGTWAVEDNKLCLKVAKWNFDGCGRMVKAGNLVTHYFPEGDKSHIVFGK